MTDGKPPKALRLPSPAMLWRLNEQGLLRLELPEDAYVPGGPPSGWTPIPHSQADDALNRLRFERWAGLERFPTSGESWVIRNGLVVPLAAVA